MNGRVFKHVTPIQFLCFMHISDRDNIDIYKCKNENVRRKGKCISNRVAFRVPFDTPLVYFY